MMSLYIKTLTVFIFFFAADAQADCPSEVTLEVHGVNQKKNTVLIGSKAFREFEAATKSKDKVLAEAYLYEFDLNEDKAPLKIIHESFNSELFGEKLIENYEGHVKAFLMSGGSTDAMTLTPGKSVKKDKYGSSLKTHYPDLRKSGGDFVVLRATTKKSQKTHFKLQHELDGHIIKLKRNLFSKTKHNQAGIEVKDTAFFTGSYLAGAGVYCGEPLLWSHELKYPYKKKTKNLTKSEKKKS